MMLDLTDDEKLALVAHLRHALEYAPFPYAPRPDPLIRAKLEPAPQPEPLPPLRPGDGADARQGATETGIKSQRGSLKRSKH